MVAICRQGILSSHELGSLPTVFVGSGMGDCGEGVHTRYLQDHAEAISEHAGYGCSELCRVRVLLRSSPIVDSNVSFHGHFNSATLPMFTAAEGKNKRASTP